MIKYLLAMAFLVMPLVSFGEVPTWQIVPAQSSLMFTGTQNNAPITGQFNSFTGDIHVDPDNLAASHVHIVIDMGSVTTSYKELTATLVTNDWFGVKVFPQATFDSTSFTKTGDKMYQVNGNLKIRDKTVPVVLDVVEKDYSPTNATVEGTATLHRTQFGVGSGEWAHTDQVKDEVKVNFKLVATKK